MKLRGVSLTLWWVVQRLRLVCGGERRWGRPRHIALCMLRCHVCRCRSAAVLVTYLRYFNTWEKASEL